MNRREPQPLTMSPPSTIRAGPGRGGAAVLLVTHNPELARAADRVLYLVEGRLTLGTA